MSNVTLSAGDWDVIFANLLILDEKSEDSIFGWSGHVWDDKYVQETDIIKNLIEGVSDAEPLLPVFDNTSEWDKIFEDMDNAIDAMQANDVGGEDMSQILKVVFAESVGRNSDVTLVESASIDDTNSFMNELLQQISTQNGYIIGYEYTETSVRWEITSNGQVLNSGEYIYQYESPIYSVPMADNATLDYM